jgi:hypothetical protein
MNRKGQTTAGAPQITVRLLQKRSAKKTRLTDDWASLGISTSTWWTWVALTLGMEDYDQGVTGAVALDIGNGCMRSPEPRKEDATDGGEKS